MQVAAFDLGGTRLKAALVDGGTVGSVHAHDVAGDTFEDAFGALEALAGELGGAPDGVGLCVPGLVDDHGVVVSLPGKLDGIVGVDLPGRVRDTLSLPCVVTNDAVAYGTGEAVAGAGRGADRVVVVTIGTGVGVTCIDRERPVTSGVLGGGILGGFIPISEATAGPADTDGGHGTIEALCRAERIAHLAGAERVEDAYTAYDAGNPSTHEGMAAYRRHLVRALVALANAHTPSRIVIGGGPAARPDILLHGVEVEVNARLWATFTVEIRPAELGDAAALAGIGHLFAERA